MPLLPPAAACASRGAGAAPDAVRERRAVCAWADAPRGGRGVCGHASVPPRRPRCIPRRAAPLFPPPSPPPLCAVGRGGRRPGRLAGRPHAPRGPTTASTGVWRLGAARVGARARARVSSSGGWGFPTLAGGGRAMRAAEAATAAMLLVLAVAAVPAGVGSAGDPQVQGSAARQAAYAALRVPDSCAGLEELLADARARGALAKRLAAWLVAIIVVRTLVALADEQVDQAYWWTILLGAGAISVVVRLGVVVVSVWQLTRQWDMASTLVEYRLLVVAVVFDAATWVVRLTQLLSDFLNDRVSLILFAGDPPTYRICDETKRLLQTTTLHRGPLVLQSQLHFLVSDHECLSYALQQDAEMRDVIRRPFSLLLVPVAFPLLCWSMVRRWGAMSAAVEKGLDAADIWVMTRWIDIWIAAHQDDGAVAAALDDHLLTCTLPPGLTYKRHLALVKPFWASSLLSQETTLRFRLSCSHRRLLALSAFLIRSARTLVP